METLGIIDGYIYYDYIDKETKDEIDIFLNKNIYTISNDCEYFILLLVFVGKKIESIIKNLEMLDCCYSEIDNTIIDKLIILFNMKQNLHYMIINSFNKKVYENLKKDLIDKNFFDLDLIQYNTECIYCNKKLYCNCFRYNKKIPFSLCRFNKISNDGIRSERIYNDNLDKDLIIIHFCSIECECNYYQSNNVSKLKID